jgi:hypothetical protein
VRFDDRLRTVLAQPAADPHDRAVRWRQLVELVARSAIETDPQLVERALAEIRDSAGRIDEQVRSAAALAVARLQLPVGLVAAFAADKIAVAAPILASARLTASEWKSVSAAASDDCRAFIATMHSHPPAPAEPRVERVSDREAPGPVPSIGEVVARIERLRQQREGDSGASPAAPDTGEAPRLFKWECNESGEIDWVEGAPRGALVGQSIASKGVGGGVDPSVERAFAARAPFHEGVLELPDGGRIGGTWKISGVPAFERGSGRFAGYRGVAERPSGAFAEAQPPIVDPNSLRELAHEIKTPLNAIIGFAEIIAGEYFGPADTRSRERADEIVAQARLLLAAVEDLDFAAKLRSSGRGAEAELADCLAGAWEEIERLAEMRGVRVAVAGGDAHARCLLDPQLAQRLVERLCLAVVGSAAAGETLTFRIGSDGDFCVIGVNRPASLSVLDLAPDRNRRSSDAASLPLRLVMGLARAAGGDLVATPDELSLRLPKA